VTPAKPLDILLVSNLWPPHYIGGYELGAQDVARRLEARGHRITVLTSTYGVGMPTTDGRVHRVLYEQVRWRPLYGRQLVTEAVAAARARRRSLAVLDRTCFDLVYLFSPLGLNAAFVQALCGTGRPVVAYVSDNWVASWPWVDRWLAQVQQPRPFLSTARKIAMVLAKRAFRRAGVMPRFPEWLPVRHFQFVSRFIREISLTRAEPWTQEIIPWGIEVARFPFRERGDEEFLRWTYVGQIAEHKGPQVAVEAIKLLRSQGQQVTLDLFGDDSQPYAQALKERVRREGLGDFVRFMGARAREELPQVAYAHAGVLVFPTEWEEPFSITLLEAFASGVPVLTTLTGGTGEIVRHGETATVFSAGSAQHLAAQWYSIARHPERARRMAARAREAVERHLDIESMVDRIEKHLTEVSEGRGSAGAEYIVPAPHPWEPPDVSVSQPTRAVEPDPHDGSWLTALWRDLAEHPIEQTCEPEVDTPPDKVFPIAFPPSVILNGRFGDLYRGRILNAGAGTTRVLEGRRQVRVDIQLHNRPDVCSDLHALPFRDATFDTVFSIAVLEHCRRPWVAIRELRRVLRPGGHLLLSLPFIQPAHANPDDYFRFTAEGMRELAADAGLTVLETGPDNSAQHTLAWVLWELVRYHPRHRYLASDIRVHEWFDAFSRRAGRVVLPTLGNGFYLVAQR